MSWSPTPGPARTISILYVGPSQVADDAALRELQHEKLLNSIEAFTDSPAALARILSTTDPVDLVLIDEELARSDGWILLREVAERPASRRPVVLTVASAHALVDESRPRPVGSAGRLVRPFRALDLVRMVQDLPGFGLSLVVRPHGPMTPYSGSALLS